jgi:hypothetical protein
MDSVHNLSDEMALVFVYLAFILSEGVSRTRWFITLPTRAQLASARDLESPYCDAAHYADTV